MKNTTRYKRNLSDPTVSLGSNKEARQVPHKT